MLAHSLTHEATTSDQDCICVQYGHVEVEKKRFIIGITAVSILNIFFESKAIINLK